MSDYFYSMCRTWRDIILRRDGGGFFTWLFFIAILPLAPAMILGWFLADLFIGDKK